MIRKSVSLLGYTEGTIVMEGSDDETKMVKKIIDKEEKLSLNLIF